MFETFDFLQGYSRERQYFLSLPSLWKVNFQYSREGALAPFQEGIPGSATDGPTGLPSAIQRALNKADEGWRIQNEPLEFTKNGSILVAREVTVPQENSQFLATGDNINKGNYLPAFGLEKRPSFLERNLAINFFDTEEDIEHNFFRPWQIAIAIEGLLQRDLLCPVVELLQYNNRGQVRKGYRFIDVFPTNVEGYNLNYNNTEFIEKSVTFAFKNYKQI